MPATQPSIWGAVLWVACVSGSGTALASPGGSGVRTPSPVITMLIRDGAERSATVRGLLSAVAMTYGIVYITPARCGRVRACLLHRINMAGPHRVLHILIDPLLHDDDVIVALAHELQHAVEVLSDPRITTDAAILAYYRAHGIEMHDVLETRAIQAGDTRNCRPSRSEPVQYNRPGSTD